MEPVYVLGCFVMIGMWLITRLVGAIADDVNEIKREIKRKNER